MFADQKLTFFRPTEAVIYGTIFALQNFAKVLTYIDPDHIYMEPEITF